MTTSLDQTQPANRETATANESPPGATVGAGSARLTPRLRAILAVVLIADVLDLMDSTITNIAAPSIVREIGGGESLIKSPRSLENNCRAPSAPSDP